jgi:hypothetical protein
MLKIPVGCDATPCRLVNIKTALGEHTASIFRVSCLTLKMYEPRSLETSATLPIGKVQHPRRLFSSTSLSEYQISYYILIRFVVSHRMSPVSAQHSYEFKSKSEGQLSWMKFWWFSSDSLGKCRPDR